MALGSTGRRGAPREGGRRRILAVSSAAGLGGAEYALLRIARRLPAHGLDVELAVPGAGGLAASARAAGIRVHRLAVGGLSAGAWPRAAVDWPRARRLRRRSGFELVWLNGTVAQRAAPGFGGPLVPHVHDLLDRAPRPWRSRRFWRSAPIVLCDSQAVADRAAALGAPPERLRVVYCPLEAVEPAPRPEWADGRPVVGFVGRIEPRKGTLELLRAAPALFERHPEARIVIVGGDDLASPAPYREQVHARAATLGDRVLLAGAVGDAARLMPWFTVLAVPSLEEPFGTVAAEALAGGTPVVATRSGGMEEYVVPGRNGALVAPADPDALADALDATLRDAGRLGAAGPGDVERFEADRVAGTVAAALHEALEAGPGEPGREAPPRPVERPAS